MNAAKGERECIRRTCVAVRAILGDLFGDGELAGHQSSGRCSSNKISQLLVVTGDGTLVGALNMHDLFRAKVI
jgi:CBS domain-containing protein